MNWTKRWGYEMSARAVKPGVYALRTGGFFATVSVMLSRPKRRVMRQKALHEATLTEAVRWREATRVELIQRGVPQRQRSTTFDDYATSLFEEKVQSKRIRSAKGRQKWESTLRLHLFPRFGALECRDMRHADCADWRKELAAKVASGKLSASTVNGWMSVMRVITAAMTLRFELDRDPMKGIDSFDESQSPTYTLESPNALRPEQAREFLAIAKRDWPQFYGMILLGFVTGKRPSTLRPLRRTGKESDIDWDTGVIHFRRSHTVRQEVMHGTKTKKHETVFLPPFVVDALRAEVRALTGEKAIMSDYLFPSRRGGMRSASCLDKPFADICRKMGLPFKATPRAMRRTFQDLARVSGIHDTVTRSISGHATAGMQIHYSTAAADEQREAIGQIAQLTGMGKGPVKRKEKRSGKMSGKKARTT